MCHSTQGCVSLQGLLTEPVWHLNTATPLGSAPTVTAPTVMLRQVLHLRKKVVTSTHLATRPPVPQVQEFVTTDVPGVSCSSMVASTTSPLLASKSAIVSSTVHLQTGFVMCEEKEAAHQQHAAVQGELGAVPAMKQKF